MLMSGGLCGSVTLSPSVALPIRRALYRLISSSPSSGARKDPIIDTALPLSGFLQSCRLLREHCPLTSSGSATTSSDSRLIFIDAPDGY